MFTAHKLQGAGGVGGGLELAYLGSSSGLGGSFYYPSAPQAGDLIVVSAHSWASESTAGSSTPAGWIKLANTASLWSTYPFYQTVTTFYKIATGLEGSYQTGFDIAVSSGGDPAVTGFMYRGVDPISSVSVFDIQQRTLSSAGTYTINSSLASSSAVVAMLCQSPYYSAGGYSYMSEFDFQVTQEPSLGRYRSEAKVLNSNFYDFTVTTVGSKRCEHTMYLTID